MKRSSAGDEYSQNGSIPHLSRHDLDFSVNALQLLLQSPIKFVPATDRTYKDDSNVAIPVQPSRLPQDPFKNEDQYQVCVSRARRSGINRFLQASQISTKCNREATEHTSSKGFQNHDVMCYRNSTIQALFHSPKFVKWLKLHHAHGRPSKNCTACALRNLCITYWDDQSRTRELDNKMAQLIDNLRGTRAFAKWSWYRQQDANEFHLYLINAVIERHPEFVARIHTPCLEQLTTIRSESTLQALLGHVVARTTTCSNCGNESRVLSPYEYRLGVALEKGNRLDELLRTSTFAPIRVIDYHCEKCNRRCRAEQNSSLTEVPDILEIELLRFKQEGRGHYVKNSKSISFDQDLELKGFSETSTSLRYRLLSVVQHVGSFKMGHYRCVAKGPSGSWEILEDSTVRKAHTAAALSPAGGWTPYTLFYARSDANEPAELPAAQRNIPNGSSARPSECDQRAPKRHRPDKSALNPGYRHPDAVGPTVG